MSDALDVVDGVEQCLKRLDDDRWGAVVHRRDEEVRVEARLLEQRRRRSDPVGPLAGTCFTVKAALRTGALPATAGSLLLDDRPGRAAPVVERLRRAGALLVGVTNCAEFALAPVTDNRRYGPTANPVARGWTVGGSSAGCAAAVAGGLVPFSIGTDYGGSVRFPASCTEVYGFRPGRRQVPSSGQVPAAPTGSPRARFSLPGVLAVDVEVLTAVLPVFLGRPLQPQRPARCAWVATIDGQPVDPDVAAATRHVASRLGAGHVEQIGTDPLLGADALFDRIRATDDLEPIRTLASARSGELTIRMRTMLDERPLPVDPIAEAAAEDLRRRALQFIRRCPLLVAPVATTATPREGDDVPFTMLAPSRAVSLLGLAALAVPAGRASTGAPIGVQLIGSVEAILWAARELAGAGEPDCCPHARPSVPWRSVSAPAPAPPRRSWPP